MRGIDHLVLCGRDLERMREVYARLGFTLTPPARHPFGTGNSLIQLQGCFLELLTVMDKAAIPQRQPEHFSFAAFNRDFLARGEGFSMLVLDSRDARADVAAFAAARLDVYAPFDFSRKARLPDGNEVTVGFSLAFVSHPDLPMAGFFTCQQRAPEHFWKPEYQRHANGATTLCEVCLVDEQPWRVQPFMTGFVGTSPTAAHHEELRYRTARGEVVVVSPDRFRIDYGIEPPDLSAGGRFAAYTVAVPNLDPFEQYGLVRVDDRLVLPPERSFGVAIAFATGPRQ